jgi:hypothetical protein
MSKIYAPRYNIEATSNVDISSENLNLKSLDINVYGNFNIFGKINGPGLQTQFDTLEKLTIITDLIVKNTIKSNHFILVNGKVDGIVTFSDSVTFNQSITTNTLNMNNGVINLQNGTIMGPVKIYGLEVVNNTNNSSSGSIITNHIVFKNLQNDSINFSVESTETPPPEGSCPTWIKVMINGKPFYLFSQSPI